MFLQSGAETQGCGGASGSRCHSARVWRNLSGARSNLSGATETFGQISAEFAPWLCLDVFWGNPAAGTPVWLYDCFMNDPQWWSYNRETGSIVNPAFGSASR